MQTSPPSRFIVSAVTFALAILILILVTVNYVRITQVDNSPGDGVTQMRPTSTPTVPGAVQSPVVEATTTVATPAAGGTEAPTDTAVPTAEQPSPTLAPTSTPEVSSFPTPTIDLTPTPSSPEGQALQTLSRAIVPARDLYAIAARLRLKTTDPIPTAIASPAGNYPIGHTDTFFVNDLPAKRYYPFYKVKSRLVRMLEYDDVTTLWRACLVVA